MQEYASSVVCPALPGSDARVLRVPLGSPEPTDPTRHLIEPKRAWTELRKQADVSCRLHDLRQISTTALPECGVPEGTMLARMGQMSRAMLERYSHIGKEAKIDAVA